MNRRRDEQDDDQADRLVSRLWRSVAPPDEHELRDLARRAASEHQGARAPFRARRRLRARWAVALGTAALLIGSGLGFGLGNIVTPSGSAGRNVVGFGFLPERGWNVVQTAGPVPGATTATASKDGIVLTVTSTPRGDPAEDVRYDLRELPLQVAAARRSARNPARLELRAGVGGYNIDAHVEFRSATPSAAMLASAQRQLNRLVVAADRVTIAVRPTVTSPLTQVTVFGTIDNGSAGESVTVQAKDCGTTFFRAYAGASTEVGGSWSTLIFPTITTKLRAVWNNETSAEVTLQRRVFLGFVQRSATRFRVYLAGYGTRFIGKRVNIQRFDQRLGRWELIRKVVLESERYGTTFALRVAKGTQLRAVLPNAQAGSCYLGATSPVRRT